MAEKLPGDWQVRRIEIIVLKDIDLVIFIYFSASGEWNMKKNEKTFHSPLLQWLSNLFYLF